MATIRQVDGQADLENVRSLFREYAESLAIDLEFQDFNEELASLPGAYVPPAGCLLVAVTDDQWLGCVGVRRFDVAICEMKRLYVRPLARGRRVGRALAEAAITFGRSAGYASMRLDTLPAMLSAQCLYGHLGFREVPPYRHNPVPGTKFMELALGVPLGGTT